MLHSFFSFLDRIFPTRVVFAHCDIPCGIYTVEPAQTAAATVVRMVEKLQQADSGDIHSITRFTHTKEEHAQICKEQLLILWTDYFKEEHLQDFSNLHETFWKAAKLCSQNKQEVSMEYAKDLKTAVDEIAKMFERAQSAKK